ncbi:MAG: hypothetical protein RR595_13680 [Lysinibacillus sp.]
MKTLLFGNGVNIQFGGKENSNKEILLRSVKKCRETNFPNHIIIDDSELIVGLLGNLFRELSEILNNEYGKYAISTDERTHLEELKLKYSNKKSLNFTDIGFEDYYLIYDLMCNKNKIKNPDRYYIREALKMMFILSIYNDGRINENHKKFPRKLKDFFREFDFIFTTNYDQNVEVFINKDVYYLHGAFKYRADVYREDSLRNKLSDRPIDKQKIDENYYYLYSNVLTTYNGNYKSSSMEQATTVNSALNTFSEGYMKDEQLKETVASWMTEENHILRNLAESIMLKSEDESLRYEELYPVNEFNQIEDELIIVGLSPFNDTHIFKYINENSKLKKVLYYYYLEDEKKVVASLLNNIDTEFKQVSQLWSTYM